jgi:hypothetical protein
VVELCSFQKQKRGGNKPVLDIGTWGISAEARTNFPFRIRPVTGLRAEGYDPAGLDAYYRARYLASAVKR